MHKLITYFTRNENLTRVKMNDENGLNSLIGRYFV